MVLKDSPELDISSVPLIHQGTLMLPLKCKQIVSPYGKIMLKRKGWIIRIFSLITLISLISLYTYFGIINPEERLIMVYTSFMISLSIIIFVFGWIFYRNPSSFKGDSINKSLHTEKDLFSIIIPVFNQKEMIETVINSIYASTYKNIEVIAVNDGSTDDSGRVLDSLKKKFPNLKIVHKTNEGKRKAVSSGFQQSVGKFLILIDSDSIVDSNAIEEFAKVFNSDPTIGAVAGQAKIFNANENTLTKCQDSWYDYEYNIYKACESYFGTVTCCSGCLAGYRREAIENVLFKWSNNDDKIVLDGPKTPPPYVKRIKRISKIRTILLDKIYNIRFNLLNSLLSYDDSEDRALTTYCLMKWKSVYLSTAIAYTDVPSTFSSFIKQQQRWKKGYLRANIFASLFFWSKKNPIIAILFYCGLLITIVAPIVTVIALSYGIFVLSEPLAPISLITGYIAIGFLEGIDYKMRDFEATNWKYRPIMNLLLSFVISWLILSAIINYKKDVWLTR